MLLGAHNQNHANIAASKGATDFSIAAIMARGSSSREPSERSLSECEVFILYTHFVRPSNIIDLLRQMTFRYSGFEEKHI